MYATPQPERGHTFPTPLPPPLRLVACQPPQRGSLQSTQQPPHETGRLRLAGQGPQAEGLQGQLQRVISVESGWSAALAQGERESKHRGDAKRETGTATSMFQQLLKGKNAPLKCRSGIETPVPFGTSAFNGCDTP